MGGIAEVLRSAVAAVSDATESLQEPVTLEYSNGRNSVGTELPPQAPVVAQALVQRKSGVLAIPGNLEIKYSAVVSFLAPVDVDATTKVTLSDGLTGPLYIPSGGLSDPSTKKPYLRIVYLRR